MYNSLLDYPKFTLRDYKDKQHNESLETDLLDQFQRLPEVYEPNIAEDIISRVIRIHFPGTKYLLLLDFRIEQCENVYDVLIDNRRVAVIEVPRQIGVTPSDVVVTEETTSQYRKRGGRFVMRFDIAVKLMHSMIQKSSEQI